jgi:hypothetical protein
MVAAPPASTWVDLSPNDLGISFETVTADPLPPTMNEDGEWERYWVVDGEVRRFILTPHWPHAARPVYWNPIHPGQEMWWRSQKTNRLGYKPVIQKETWIEGKFAPRNSWEELMTREYLLTLPGGNPDKWKGSNHPDGEEWRCGDCKWLCGNWGAFKDHCKHWTHGQSVE